MSVPEVSGWLLEVPVSNWRIFLRPMVGNGAPYDVSVFSPRRKQVLRYVGAATAERALESAGTAISLAAGPGAVNRRELQVIGERLDGGGLP